MVIDGNHTYYDEHLVMCITGESLSCSSETNMMYLNHSSIKE